MLGSVAPDAIQFEERPDRGAVEFLYERVREHNLSAAGLPEARDLLALGREQLRDAHRQHRSGRASVRLQSELIDRLVRGLFAELASELEPSASAGVALVAVGGYGRRELAPRSDLDLWLLGPASRGVSGQSLDAQPPR